MQNYKIQKINSLVGETITNIINKKFSEEIQFMSINFTDTAKDLSQTKIYVSFAKNQEKNFKQLLSKRKQIQSIFAKTIKLRRTPKIYFLEDKKLVSINRVEDILNKLKNEN